MAKKMGFEGVLYYGAAGSTASTQITNRRDVNINTETEKGDTTTAGAGSSVPIGTSRVSRVNISIEWTMLEDASDTTLEALKVAAAAGSPVALRTKDYAAGKGFDGDVVLDVRKGLPIAGEQTVQFTATPCDDNRAPIVYT